MKFGLYAIRDVHTGFLSPVPESNDNVAIRNFAHAVMNDKSVMNSHPEHFSLYKIGEFESDNGQITPLMAEHIYDATEVF